MLRFTDIARFINALFDSLFNSLSDKIYCQKCKHHKKAMIVKNAMNVIMMLLIDVEIRKSVKNSLIFSSKYQKIYEYCEHYYGYVKVINNCFILYSPEYEKKNE